VTRDSVGTSVLRGIGVRRQVVAVAAVMATLAALGAPSPAAAGIQQELAVFATCPISTPGVTACIVSRTTAGEFVLGSKAVTVNKTITLQGGLSELTNQLVPPTDGNTLSKTPLTVPGGLVGIEVDGITEVTATAELAGPVLLELENLGSNNPAVVLPLKVKLDNPVLGNGCYIGSNTEPTTLSLITGTTNPPPPNKPITGNKGEAPIFLDHNKIIVINHSSLVDNSFSVPGVNGCGLLPLVIDPVVDLDAGLPAAAGKNTAILSGGFLAASSRTVTAERALPEVGRCVKVPGVKEEVEEGVVETVFHGAFENSTCVGENLANHGKFEWLPGPGANSKFTGASAATTLETVGHAAIKCAAGAYAGEYTGPKTATETIKLTGCQRTLTKQACQSAGAAAGEIVSSPLEGALGFVQDFYEGETLHLSVGLDVKHSPSLVAAECGATKEAVVVEGSVIGPFGTVDKMVAANTVKYKATAGKQAPEGFEGGPNDTLLAHFGTGSEQAGLTGVEKVTNGEKLEIKGASVQ
jgi:hypothetical protein